ncbi:MAG TPA: glycosyltransferase family 4 protein [Acidobacteriota bacterium]|nr:glycosyltransferase family 4 protein [Acidobacteriota bacterium]
MKILMIAPEPFFQPRGTPFSEFYRIRCLSELGHSVDLVTYPIGEDVDIPGLRIFRSPSLLGIKEIPIGPSAAKIPLDAALFFSAWRRLAFDSYDAIHSHEEAGIMGHFFSRLYGLPHVYDMHSSLPQQLENFRFTNSRAVRAGFEWMESVVVRSADAVIAICPSLVETVHRIDPGAKVTLIENTAESHDVDKVPASGLEELRAKLGLVGKRVILYIGTFEAYQGLDVLLAAASRIAAKRDDAALLLVGGRPDQVEEQRAQAISLGIGDFCRFSGQIAHSRVPHYLRLADVLVSPRSAGTNTPLKIYSYLRAGAPIVATDMYTHTQVLSPEVAMLVPPEPEPFAEAIERLLDDRGLSEQITDAAFRLSEEHYSYNRYVEKTRAVYESLSGNGGHSG